MAHLIISCLVDCRPRLYRGGNFAHGADSVVLPGTHARLVPRTGADQERHQAHLEQAEAERRVATRAGRGLWDFDDVRNLSLGWL